jgi:TRAP-type C4-dicarboxylate transport system permease small subunit
MFADRLVAAAERVAGALLAGIAALTFVAVALRYLFSTAIPDSYDLSRNLLGILIFWGIAVTSFRGDHITVDLLWGVLPGSARRALDLAATGFALVCMAAFAWAMALKVRGTWRSAEATYDLRLPVWPFYLLAWLGLLAAVLLLVLRLVRQFRAPAAAPAGPPASH